LWAFTCRFFVLCFPTTKSRGIYRTQVSINYDLSESVEILERSNDKNNAHVIEKVEKVYVTEKVERSAEEVDADLVEMVEDAHEVMSDGHEVMSGELYVMTLQVLGIDMGQKTRTSTLFLLLPPL
jgi:hypothetical protein